MDREVVFSYTTPTDAAVTGSARVWYLIDDDRRTIWLVHAGPGHPKATE